MRRIPKFRQIFRDECEQRSRPCHLCGQPIDYTLSKPHPQAFEMDHVTPEAFDGTLHDFDNVAPSHARCNRIAGAGLWRLLGDA